jgi:RNA polymerase sigma-70 factor (ECF subfamily)
MKTPLLSRVEDIEVLVAQARTELPYKFSAFEQLAKLQFGPLRAIAFGIVRDGDLADGIAQDSLLRIMHALPKLESVDKYPAWSRRIVVNVARSGLSKEKREQQKRSAYAAETSWESAPAEETATFADLIAELSIDERTVVTLKIMDDLEFNQIAEITGYGVSATKMRYYRALEKIKAREEQRAD